MTGRGDQNAPVCHGEQLFFSHVRLHGGPAPVRHYLPQLIKLVLEEKVNPGKVFDLVLPLDQGAEGYRAMDERRAIRHCCARKLVGIPCPDKPGCTLEERSAR